MGPWVRGVGWGKDKRESNPPSGPTLGAVAPKKPRFLFLSAGSSIRGV